MRRWLLFLLIGLPVWTFACDCPDLSLDSAFARANVIWVGTCMDVTPNRNKGDLNVVFQVDSSWKRQVEHVATLHTPNNSCGFTFKPGSKYLVVGIKHHQSVQTDACSGTMVLPEVLPSELKRLGRAFPPGRPDFASRMNWVLIGLGVASLLFMALIVLRKRIFKVKPS